MAKLEPRIWPLLEMLSRSRLDWLAQDVLQTVIQSGVETESLAQQAANRSTERRSTGRDGPDADSRVPEGDAQLQWAVSYITNRLWQIVKLSAESLSMIDKLVVHGERETSGGLAKAADLGRPHTALILTGDDGGAIDRESLTEAFAPLEQLEVALIDWLDETLGRGKLDAE